MRSFVCMISLFFIAPIVASGQAGVMTKLERGIINLLERDQRSVLVSYMPEGRSFGVADLPGGDQLVIVKIGARTYFVSQETGFVYVPADADGPLVRLDNNKIFGTEYRVDPFARKDSLFMVATSRFLKGNGFLAYFDTTVHDWKAYRGNDEVIKESTRPYYDAKSDHLYLVCDHTYDERVDSATASMDNVLRFSFQEGKWEMVGKLDTDVYSSATSVPVHMNWLTSFGAGNLEAGDLNVVQPDQNRWLSTDSSFRERMYRQVPSIADTGKVLQLFHMGDTLYAFTGTSDSVRLDRIALRESDFTINGGVALYDVVQSVPEESGSKLLTRLGLALLILALLGAMVFLYVRKLASPGRKAVNDEPGAVMQANGTTSVANAVPAKQPVQYFLESLSSVERGLVLELSRYALRETMMDTQSLNQILGVSQKEPEVQKVRRSLTITRINANFSQMLQPDTALIRREKDPSDKRVFLYYVTKEYAGILLDAAPTPEQ